MVVPETPEPRRSARLSWASWRAAGPVIPDTPTSPVQHRTRVLETPEVPAGSGRAGRVESSSPRRVQHPVFPPTRPGGGWAPPSPRQYAAATQEAAGPAKVAQWLQCQRTPPPGPASHTCRLTSPMALTPAHLHARLDLPSPEPRGRDPGGLSVTDLSTDSAQALIAQWEGREAGPEPAGVAASGIMASVVACVQVRSRHENRSKFVEQELVRLGAVITGTVTKKTTHLIFKDGHLSTYNKAKRQGCFIVSVRWVLASRDRGYPVDEGQFPSVSCSQYDSPGVFPKLRKLKSMQPKSDAEMRQWIEARSRRRAKGREASLTGTPEAAPLFRPVPQLDLVPPIERSQDKDDILNILDELRSPRLWASPTKATAHGDVTTPLGSPCSSEDFDTPLARRLVKKYFRTPVAAPPKSPLNRASANDAGSPSLRSPLTRPNGTEPDGRGDDGHSSPEPEPASEPASSPFYVKSQVSLSSSDIDPPRRNLAEHGLLATKIVGKRCRETSLGQNREEKKALVTLKKPIQPDIKNPKFKKRHQLFSQNDLLSETPDLVQTDVLKPIVENVHTQVTGKGMPKTKSKTKIIRDHSRILMAQPPRTQIKEPSPQKRKEKKVKCSIVTSSTSSVASSASCFPTQARRIQPSRRSSVEFRTPNVKKRPKRPLWSEIVCTACCEEELTVTRQVLNTLGKFKLAPKVTPLTSHVIVGGDRGRWRTINLLKGVLQGCWIVSIEWVRNCLKHGYHVDEEPYERVDLSRAVQRCRLDRICFGQDVYKSDLFASVGPVFISGSRTDQVSRTELKELVQLGGGQVVKQVREAHVIIGESTRPIDIGSAQMHLRESWILDSILHHEIQPVSDYLLQSA